MLRLDSIHKSFKHKPNLFNGLNLNIKERSVTVVSGPSGSGKTTLLKIIRGEIKPDAGRVFVSGKDISKLTKKSVNILRRTIAFSYQDTKLLEHRTVIENIALPLRIKGIHGESLRNRVEVLIELFKIENIAFAETGYLSGGEKRKVSLAMSLAASPEILLADEPVSGLDPDSALEIINILKSLPHEEGITLIIASHHPEIKKHFYFGNLYKIKAGRLESDYVKTDYLNLP